MTDLWQGLREGWWGEKAKDRHKFVREPERPAPPRPPAPVLGDWLAEFKIRPHLWPPAPEGWALRQLYQAHGPVQGDGQPLRSLCLVYLHLSTARGATAVLHRGVTPTGRDSWKFDPPGFVWTLCTDLDCEHDRSHPLELRTVDTAAGVKAVLSNPERTNR